MVKEATLHSKRVKTAEHARGKRTLPSLHVSAAFAGPQSRGMFYCGFIFESQLSFRESDRNFSALIHNAVQRDFRMVQFCSVLYNGNPKPRTADFF